MNPQNEKRGLDLVARWDASEAREGAQTEGTRGQGDMGTREREWNSPGDTWARGHGDKGARAMHARGHGDTGTWGHGDKGMD